MAGNIGNIAKVKVAGPQRLVFGGQTLGHTLDGVTFTYERSFTDVYVDQYGETSIDKVLMGQTLQITFQMAETDWTNWNAAIPETSSQSSTYARTDLGADAGASLRAEAQQLSIHPNRLLDTDTSEDIVIYKAVSTENIEVVLKNDEQKVIEVTFTALVDESYGPGRRLGHIGSAAVS
jgi:hypothetical protein